MAYAVFKPEFESKYPVPNGDTVDLQVTGIDEGDWTVEAYPLGSDVPLRIPLRELESLVTAGASHDFEIARTNRVDHLESARKRGWTGQ